MNGEPLRTYFHWLALTYGITLTGHPAVSIPCGVDEQGMPFGLQIVGPHKARSVHAGGGCGAGAGVRTAPGARAPAA